MFTQIATDDRHNEHVTVTLKFFNIFIEGSHEKHVTVSLMVKLQCHCGIDYIHNEHVAVSLKFLKWHAHINNIISNRNNSYLHEIELLRPPRRGSVLPGSLKIMH